MCEQLPPDISWGEFVSFKTNSERWISYIRRKLSGTGVSQEPISRFSSGANLVVSVGKTLVFKLFPPFLFNQFESEIAGLSQFSRRLSVETPEIISSGKDSGWGWIVMTQLHGVTGEAAWPTLSPREKIACLNQLGSLIAEVQHRELGATERLEPHWPAFISHQIENCHEHHQKLGMPAFLLNDLERLLDGAERLADGNRNTVILTGEFIPPNLMMRQTSLGWRISGLFDFGDVMTGLGRYDLLGPSSFMINGVAAYASAFFSGYGYLKQDLTRDFARELMQLMVLHRFSNFNVQIAIPDWQAQVQNFDELARLIWPFDEIA